MKNLSNSKILKRSAALWLCLIAFACFANGQVAGGGNYTLMQTAIANGGASISGNYSFEDTI